MKTLLSATAITMALTAIAHAQDATSPVESEQTEEQQLFGDANTDQEEEGLGLDQIESCNADSTMLQMEADWMDARSQQSTPEIERTGYGEASFSEIEPGDLTGIDVYDPEDNRVGTIGNLLTDEAGAPVAATIDVSDYLGGEQKVIGRTFDEIRLLQAEEGEELRAYIDATPDALSSEKAYMMN